MESYEGGICTPLIAYWPKGIKAKQGSVTNQVGHVIDFMATVQEMAGVKYSAAFKGNKITPTEGQSLLPVFKNEKRKGHEYLFFEHVRGRAVRNGDWKLVTLGPKRQWELYNLKDDRTETRNLAAQYPELVKKLESKWLEWANAKNVLPKPEVKSKE